MAGSYRGQPVEMARVDEEPWSTPANAWDVTNFSDVEIQVDGNPSTAYQPQRSLNGDVYYNCIAYDGSGNAYSTITAPGIYSFPGLGYLKFSAGAGSTITRRASA